MISIKIENRVGNFLIDTGASCCVTSEHILPFDQELKQVPKHLVIRSAGNHEMRFLGIASLPIKFPALGQEIFCYFDCLVCSGSMLGNFDGILCLSMLKALYAKVDVDKMTLSLKGIEIPVFQIQTGWYLPDNPDEFGKLITHLRMINCDFPSTAQCLVSTGHATTEGTNPGQKEGGPQQQ